MRRGWGTGGAFACRGTALAQATNGHGTGVGKWGWVQLEDGDEVGGVGSTSSAGHRVPCHQPLSMVQSRDLHFSEEMLLNQESHIKG